MSVNSIKNISFSFFFISVNSLFHLLDPLHDHHLGLTSLYAITFIIWSLIAFPQKTESHIIHSIVICIEACLFGIFVITVFIDQIHSIINDRSLIDTLKLGEHSRMTDSNLPPKRVLFRKVFGSGPMICWLIPCDSTNKPTPLDLPNTYNV